MRATGLVNKLVKLYGYRWVPEVCEQRYKRLRDGIWDTLGYYDERKVHLCEKELSETSEDVSRRLGLNDDITWLALRELVRLHEHAHAMLHRVNPLSYALRHVRRVSVPIRRKKVSYIRRWYRALKPEVVEPLTEFVAYSLIPTEGVYRAIFEEVDKQAPPYYRRWQELVRVCDELRRESRQLSNVSLCELVPPIIGLAHGKVWESFDELINAVQRAKREIIETFEVMAVGAVVGCLQNLS